MVQRVQRRRVCGDSEQWARTEEKVTGVQFWGVSLGNVVVAGLWHYLLISLGIIGICTCV